MAEDVSDAFEGLVVSAALVDRLGLDVEHKDIIGEDTPLRHLVRLVSGLREILEDPAVFLNVTLLESSVEELDEVIIAEGLTLLHGTRA